MTTEARAAAAAARNERRGDTSHWQPALVDKLMRLNLILLAVMLVPFWLLTSSLSYRIALGGALLVFIGISIVELRRPRLGARGRAWFLTTVALSLSLMGTLFVGFVSGPALLASAALLISCVLLGHREMLVVVAVLLLGLAVIGWLSVTDRIFWELSLRDVRAREPVAWVRSVLVAAAILIVMGALVGLLVDRMKAAVRENRRLYREALEAVRGRDEFLSIASHELATPMAALKMSAEGITSGRIPATPDNVERSLRLVGRNVERLSRLIRQLLDVSHLDNERLVLELETVDLSWLVKDVVAMFSDRPADRQRVSLDVEPGVLGYWDRERLEQVVTNLLSNALRYAAGAPIEISVRRRGASAELRVRDRGPGIPPEIAPTLFERYVHGAHRRAGGGLGLGLYISRSLVEAHGGQIRVESGTAGATFTVELPLAGPPRPARPAKEHHEAA